MVIQRGIFEITKLLSSPVSPWYLKQGLVFSVKVNLGLAMCLALLASFFPWSGVQEVEISADQIFSVSVEEIEDVAKEKSIRFTIALWTFATLQTQFGVNNKPSGVSLQ